MPLDPASVPSTPCYVIDVGALRENLHVLDGVRRRTGCRVLLALKAFAAFSVFPVMRGHLDGTAASSVNEARLGREAFGGAVHLFAPAYRPAELEAVAPLCSHVVFNSMAQWRMHRSWIRSAHPGVRLGLRINPEHSEVEVAMYDPCRPGSRLGVRRRDLDSGDLDGLTGLHFHTLCGSDAAALGRTLGAVEEKFPDVLASIEWINFGGGHHITRDDYDVDGLCALIDDFRERFDVEVFLEPGEAVVMDAGFLVASVLDILPDGNVILDASATAHMPDVLEMPYRPDIVGAAGPGELSHRYRLGGPTCLAGDDLGEYSFSRPLAVGDRIVFEDMAGYTMVKNTMFNGVGLPAIAVYDTEQGISIVREFGYDDYISRLS